MNFKFDYAIHLGHEDKCHLRDAITCYKTYRPHEASFIPVSTIMELVEDLVQKAYEAGRKHGKEK